MWCVCLCQWGKSVSVGIDEGGGGLCGVSVCVSGV